MDITSTYFIVETIMQLVNYRLIKVINTSKSKIIIIIIIIIINNNALYYLRWQL